MNLTDGGEGGRGHKKTPLQKETARKYMIENNPARKISRDDVLIIYEMIKKGKTNKEIGDKFGLHSGYISQIRIGNKYNDLYIKHFSQKVESPGRQKISYEDFLKILALKENGLNNKEIGVIFNTDTSVICRLINRKTYRIYWDKYLECV